MKKINKLILSAVLALFTVAFSYSQNKIAHVNISEITQLLPETKTAIAELEKLQKTVRDEIEALNKELEAKVTQYRAEVESMTAMVKQTREQEMNNMQQSIQQYAQQADQNLQKTQMSFLSPIQEKVMNAVNDVAAELGLEYVYDSTPGSNQALVFNGRDISSEIKQKLGL